MEPGRRCDTYRPVPIYWASELESVIECTVYREVYPDFVVPRMLRQLCRWRWDAAAVSSRTVFATMHTVILLDDADYAEFERRCIRTVLKRRGYVLLGRSYIRMRVAQACRQYMLRCVLLELLWDFLYLVYDD